MQKITNSELPKLQQTFNLCITKIILIRKLKLRNFFISSPPSSLDQSTGKMENCFRVYLTKHQPTRLRCWKSLIINFYYAFIFRSATIKWTFSVRELFNFCFHPPANKIVVGRHSLVLYHCFAVLLLLLFGGESNWKTLESLWCKFQKLFIFIMNRKAMNAMHNSVFSPATVDSCYGKVAAHFGYSLVNSQFARLPCCVPYSMTTDDYCKCSTAGVEREICRQSYVRN